MDASPGRQERPWTVWRIARGVHAKLWDAQTELDVVALAEQVENKRNVSSRLQQATRAHAPEPESF